MPNDWNDSNDSDFDGDVSQILSYILPPVNYHADPVVGTSLLLRPKNAANDGMVPLVRLQRHLSDGNARVSE